MPRFAPHALALVLALAFAPSSRADQEAWDAIYIGDAKAGYMHLWVKPVKDSQGRELVNVRIDYELTFKRGADTAKLRMLYGTIETPTGEVLRIDTLTQASGENIRTFGDAVNGKLGLTIEVAGRKQQKVIDWGADVRGPYGAEMSLAREPLTPGESRTLKTYIPDLNKVCLTTVNAVGFEDVPLGPKGQPHSLLKIESSVTDEAGKSLPGMTSTLWVDKTGQIMKSKTDVFGGMYTYRTTKQGALAANRAEFGLLEASILKIPRPIPQPDQTRDIVYRLTGKDPAGLFPSDRRQTVRADGKGKAVIEVKADGPTTGEPGPAEVAEEYRRANPLVNSEDAMVVKRMREAVGKTTDPWQKAVRIQEWVSQNLKEKNFSTAFAPAGEVARELTGDCTEHGILVAAMCRAAGIPARCAVGLVYAPDYGGFGPHMWNEVYVNNRWVAIDAAFNQSTVDATHIKLTETSLDGPAPFETFLPVIEVFNGMTLEPVEIR